MINFHHLQCIPNTFIYRGKPHLLIKYAKLWRACSTKIGICVCNYNAIYNKKQQATIFSTTILGLSFGYMWGVEGIWLIFFVSIGKYERTLSKD